MTQQFNIVPEARSNERQRGLTDRLYLMLLERHVVTLDEIVSALTKLTGKKMSRETIRTRYLYGLMIQNKLYSIRRELYHVRNPLQESPPSISLLIASKVREGGFVGYHSALEYYGLGHSISYPEAYTCVANVADRFRPFVYDDRTYRAVVVSDTSTEVFSLPYLSGRIRVSSKDRTLVDCVDRPRYAGGWYEMIHSLMGLKGLHPDTIKRILLKRDNQFLLRRVGFVIDLLRKESSFYRDRFSHEILEELATYVEGPVRSLLRKSEIRQMGLEPNERTTVDDRWKLDVPLRLKTYLGLTMYE
ncbi:MAG: type IV toxin-antitoxin system AbiEi family antitoxin domain-containing protein [Candidatus Thorarchaeota archaeon]